MKLGTKFLRQSTNDTQLSITDSKSINIFRLEIEIALSRSILERMELEASEREDKIATEEAEHALRESVLEQSIAALSGRVRVLEGTVSRMVKEVGRAHALARYLFIPIF